MKEKYTSPTIVITQFHVEDIITSSSVSAEEFNEAEIPAVLDAGDIFNYND